MLKRLALKSLFMSIKTYAAASLSTMLIVVGSLSLFNRNGVTFVSTLTCTETTLGSLVFEMLSYFADVLSAVDDGEKLASAAEILPELLRLSVL